MRSIATIQSGTVGNRLLEYSIPRPLQLLSNSGRLLAQDWTVERDRIEPLSSHIKGIWDVSSGRAIEFSAPTGSVAMAFNAYDDLLIRTNDLLPRLYHSEAIPPTLGMGDTAPVSRYLAHDLRISYPGDFALKSIGRSLNGRREFVGRIHKQVNNVWTSAPALFLPYTFLQDGDWDGVLSLGSRLDRVEGENKLHVQVRRSSPENFDFDADSPFIDDPQIHGIPVREVGETALRPVFLDLHELALWVTKSLVNGGLVLKHEEAALRFVHTRLTQQTAYKFLSKPQEADYGLFRPGPLQDAPIHRIPANGVYLDGQFIDQLIRDPQAGVILLDALQETDKPLVVEAVSWAGSEVLARMEIPLTTTPPPGLYVDSNRDGLIDTQDPATTVREPFRFWVNDDIDRTHSFKDSAGDTMADITEVEWDDIGGKEAANLRPDWEANDIASRRDLEDFFRLWINTQGIASMLKNGDMFLGLKWTDVSSGAPALKIYKHQEADGGTKYLTDEQVASDHINTTRRAIADIRDDAPISLIARTVVEGTDVFILPTTLFSDLDGSNAKTYLLAEGCKPGKGQLKLVILRKDGGSYIEIGEGPSVWMDLRKIGDMYEHWSVGNNSGGVPESIADRIPSLTGSGVVVKYDDGTPSPEERQYILFVHGWNMEQWEKERFAETAYKRLWWQGYKGRFGLFSWPCTNKFDETSTLGKVVEGVSDGTNFDRGEWTAWRTGAPLRQLMEMLSSAYIGELYVFSHSMGGIVVSEALRLQSQSGGGQIAKIYVASQAALSAHTYDSTLNGAPGSPNALQWTYNHPSLPNGNAIYGPHTPNVYGDWHGSVLSGDAGSSKAVGQIKNFYNRNDWALSAPVWQFNQITKPDWPDPNNDQPYIYAHQGGPDVLLSEARFGRQLDPTVPNYLFLLDLGTPADVRDRYEIMAFAAEPRVKAFGATANVSRGITRDVDLQSVWGSDPEGGNHKAHKWHSGQFRSTIQRQRNYWKTLLTQPGFSIMPTTTLP